MTFPAALAADLALLNDALGDPGVHPTPDLAETVRQLGADARAAVTSYLGLSVVVTAHEPVFRFTVLDDRVGADDVLTSLKLPLPAPAPAPGGASIAVILYAAKPGAFVDLAADLGFLTGRALSAIDLDQHLSVAPERDTTGALQAASTISQAIGVLLSRGRTPQQARRELDTHATDAGTDRHAAAELLLAGLTVTGSDL
ncbi:MAG: hypothetical protein DLM58_17765 [Pseudonocardiales bacterium]|nr:MAG: hypothetical protein DLM58_17765 [Pseudonocardiales bacterium]